MENRVDLNVLTLDKETKYKNIAFVEDSGANNSTLTSKDLSDDEVLEMLNDRSAFNLISIFVTCSFLMIVGIVGNSLVVQVYWCRMKSSAKRSFILALALLDLTVCVIVIPFEMYDLRNQVMFYQDGLCKAMRFVEYSTILSAGFVLVSVSFERYYFLCKAFQEFSPRKAKIICFVCVALAMLVATPSTIFAGSKIRQEVYGNRSVTGCECSMNSERNVNNSFKRIYYYCLTIIFFVCFIIFIVIYTIIGRLLWKYQTGKLLPDVGTISSRASSSSAIANKKMSVENSSGHSHHSCSSNKERQVSIHGKRCIKSAGSIIVFFSVTVVFVLSFLPHIIIRLMLFFGMKLEEEFDRETSELMYNFIVRSYLISNVSNPFIYSILNKSFRKELKRTFGCLNVCRPAKKGNLLQANNRRK